MDQARKPTKLPISKNFRVDVRAQLVRWQSSWVRLVEPSGMGHGISFWIVEGEPPFETPNADRGLPQPIQARERCSVLALTNCIGLRRWPEGRLSDGRMFGNHTGGNKRYPTIGQAAVNQSVVSHTLHPSPWSG